MKEITQMQVVSSDFIHSEVIGMKVPGVVYGKEYRCRICGKELGRTTYTVPSLSLVHSMRLHAEGCVLDATERLWPLLSQRRYRRTGKFPDDVAEAMKNLIRTNSDESIT